MPPIKITPSLLSADFGHLQNEIDRAENAVDGFHFDVMDGHFVPNLTAGAPVLRKIKSEKPIDAHLMVEKPELLIDDFAAAGAAAISVHFEICPHLHRLFQKIRAKKMSAGIAINPATSFEAAFEAIKMADFVLIMSVNPGFGGQKFIPEVLEKIRKIRRLFPEKDIQIDGGVNAETISDILNAGANWIVSGSFFWKSENLKNAAEILRGN